MKTSVKLLFLGILILFGTSAAIDVAYRRIYRSGVFDTTTGLYKSLDFKDFDKIQIIAARLPRATIKYGEKFSVKLHVGSGNPKIEQIGSKLLITFDDSTTGYPSNYGNGLVIECPRLKEISTDGKLFAAGTSKVGRGGEVLERDWGGVYVEGFKQDSLSIIMNNFSVLFMNSNKLKYLNANVGAQKSSRSTIDIDWSNVVLSADLNIQHFSALVMHDILIPNFKYKLSDSARVNLSGISLRLIPKQ